MLAIDLSLVGNQIDPAAYQVLASLDLFDLGLLDAAEGSADLVADRIPDELVSSSDYFLAPIVIGWTGAGEDEYRRPPICKARPQSMRKSDIAAAFAGPVSSRTAPNDGATSLLFLFATAQ